LFAAIDLRNVIVDAARAHCAKLPIAIGGVAAQHSDTYLKERFSSNKRLEGVCPTESLAVLQFTIDLEPEVRRIGAAVRLYELSRLDG
jgi:hypothetical protein